MRRREFIGLVGGAAAWPLAARAQQAKVPRVAYVLMTGTASDLAHDPIFQTFKQTLFDLGYTEGRNIRIEVHTANGDVERLPQLIRALVSSNVDVIVPTSYNVTQLAKEATQTIPIILPAGPDPVKAGWAKSLARPGGNITGLANYVSLDLWGKQMQLLKELVPNTVRLAILAPFAETHGPVVWETIEEASAALGIKVLLAEHTTVDYGNAFAIIKRERPDAMLVAREQSNYINRELIIAFAAENHIPAMYPTRHYAGSSGLISYGPSMSDQYRRAAEYVDKILKGAKPADLPFELPRKFELVINLKTAGALGLTIPPTLLALADELIE
jgi:putative tryptophan/tyrosine transport system substrate-binding protein